MKVATEFARQATQLQEMDWAMRRLGQLMNQADQMEKGRRGQGQRFEIPDQKKVKLNNRDAEKFWSETHADFY